MPSLAMEAHRSAIDSALVQACIQMKNTLKSFQHEHSSEPDSNSNSNMKYLDNSDSNHEIVEEMMASIDCVAVTKGPGLEICLRIGCNTAQVSCRLLVFAWMVTTG